MLTMLCHSDFSSHLPVFVQLVILLTYPTRYRSCFWIPLRDQRSWRATAQMSIKGYRSGDVPERHLGSYQNFRTFVCSAHSGALFMSLSWWLGLNTFDSSLGIKDEYNCLEPGLVYYNHYATQSEWCRDQDTPRLLESEGRLSAK